MLIMLLSDNNINIVLLIPLEKLLLDSCQKVEVLTGFDVLSKDNLTGGTRSRTSDPGLQRTALPTELLERGHLDLDHGPLNQEPSALPLSYILK